MKKILLLLMFSLSMAVALIFASCQKDGVLKSGQEDESSQISSETFSLQGKGQEKSIAEATLPKFELENISFTMIEAKKSRLISILLYDLSPAPAYGNDYYIELREYYEDDNNVLVRRNVIEMPVVRVGNKLDYMIYYDYLFSKEGTGNGELRFYLVRESRFGGKRITSEFRMFSVKYTEETKEKFDVYSIDFVDNIAQQKL